MINFLAVDTSSRYLTVLAVKGDRIVCNHVADCAMQHSVILMDEIDKALKQAELLPAECDFFGVVTGPGSFTGIRIGVSTAKGFSVGTGKPLVAITSFDLIAYNVEDENFYTVIDAAHGHYYVCGYGKDRQITSEPAYLDEEAVKKLSPLYGFENLALPDYTALDAGKCLYPAIYGCRDRRSYDISALYVRKSQAEEGRKC